jgi:hypothetical protein
MIKINDQHFIMQVLLLPLAALALGWLLVTIGFGRPHQIVAVDNGPLE